MGKEIKCFEDIDAWQLAMELGEQIYKLDDCPRLRADRALFDQIQRAVVSISSNIAEGYERNSMPDFARFLSYALGSCGEVRTQLMLAHRIGYIPDATAESLIHLTRRVSAATGGFRASIAR